MLLRRLASRLRNQPMSLIISQCTDPFRNLAFEDTLYETGLLSKSSILLFYSNSPCVVLGKHQNPWQEVDIHKCQNHSIEILRRNSGGGTVYHDCGNLNISFLGSKEDHCRKTNLKLIQRSLSQLGAPIDINEKDDLLIDGRKISGTAAKLGRLLAYHHCTLLVHTNLSTLGGVLSPSLNVTESKGTKSVKSPVTNLCSSLPSVVPMDSVINCIVNEYCNQVIDLESFEVLPVTSFGEEFYSKFLETHALFRTWDWIYGKTPPFKFLDEDSTMFEVRKGRLTSNSDDLTHFESIFLKPQTS